MASFNLYNAKSEYCYKLQLLFFLHIVLFIRIILFERWRPVRELLGVKLEFEITIVTVFKACLLTVKEKSRSHNGQCFVIRYLGNVFRKTLLIVICYDKEPKKGLSQKTAPEKRVK